jgi:hypothetical protein
MFSVAPPNSKFALNSVGDDTIQTDWDASSHCVIIGLVQNTESICMLGGGWTYQMHAFY